MINYHGIDIQRYTGACSMLIPFWDFGIFVTVSVFAVRFALIQPTNRLCNENDMLAHAYPYSLNKINVLFWLFFSIKMFSFSSFLLRFTNVSRWSRYYRIAHKKKFTTEWIITAMHIYLMILIEHCELS